MTVCQPLAVYPAPTRLENVWQLVQLAATISLPFPAGNSSPRVGSAEQSRAAAIKDKRSFLGIAISPQKPGAIARRRQWPAEPCSPMVVQGADVVESVSQVRPT